MGNSCAPSDHYLNGPHTTPQSKYQHLNENYQDNWEIPEAIRMSAIPSRQLQSGKTIRSKHRGGSKNNASLFAVFNHGNKLKFKQQVNTYYFRSLQENKQHFPLIRVLALELNQTYGILSPDVAQPLPNYGGQRVGSFNSPNLNYQSNDILNFRSWYNVVVQPIIPFANVPQCLSFEDCIYVLFYALAGYNYLYRKHGEFQLTAKMFGINKDGKLKVWLNENYASNHSKDQKPKVYTTKIQKSKQSALKSQQDMISSIFEIIDTKYKPHNNIRNNQRRVGFKERLQHEIRQVLYPQNQFQINHLGFQDLLHTLSDFQIKTKIRQQANYSSVGGQSLQLPLYYFIPNKIILSQNKKLPQRSNEIPQRFSDKIQRMMAYEALLNGIRSRQFKTGDKSRSVQKTRTNSAANTSGTSGFRFINMGTNSNSRVNLISKQEPQRTRENSNFNDKAIRSIPNSQSQTWMRSNSQFCHSKDQKPVRPFFTCTNENGSYAHQASYGLSTKVSFRNTNDMQSRPDSTSPASSSDFIKNKKYSIARKKSQFTGEPIRNDRHMSSNSSLFRMAQVQQQSDSNQNRIIQQQICKLTYTTPGSKFLKNALASKNKQQSTYSSKKSLANSHQNENFNYHQTKANSTLNKTNFKQTDSTAAKSFYNDKNLSGSYYKKSDVILGGFKANSDSSSLYSKQVNQKQVNHNHLSSSSSTGQKNQTQQLGLRKVSSPNLDKLNLNKYDDDQPVDNTYKNLRSFRNKYIKQNHQKKFQQENPNKNT